MKKQRRWMLVTVLGLALGCATAEAVGAETLTIFVGAGLRQPVDRLIEQFEGRGGPRVFIDYGGSGQLLAKIKAGARCDLFIPGAAFYVDQLAKDGRVLSADPIVQHTPVVGVGREQGDRIRVLADLANPGLRLAMGDPKAMAFGRTAQAICAAAGLEDAIYANVSVYGATVKQLTLYLRQGAVDAAIIGRADAFQNRDRIAIVEIPEAYFQAEVIKVALLSGASAAAEKLRSHLTTPEAVAVFQGSGFLPMPE
jgi:molybdate transport system substrate-binding protein